jgi:hypothetical protein
LDLNFQETIYYKKWKARTQEGISNETIVISCNEKNLEPRVEQRSGNFWVFYNYIQAEKKFQCTLSMKLMTLKSLA